VPNLWQVSSSAIPAGSILLVPIGSTEQHGAHLPLTTDADIASALCQRAASADPSAFVCLPLAFGASGEHQDFPGTLSIGNEALELLLLELGRSAARTFALTILVNTHGGNHAPMKAALDRLAYEQHPVISWHAPLHGDLHAGDTETSIMLALAPASVEMSRAEIGNTGSLAELLPGLISGGMRAVSPNGVLGDPTRATAAAGEQDLDAATRALVTLISDQRASRELV
jgi:mycofactocin system creatininase family protein